MTLLVRPWPHNDNQSNKIVADSGAPAPPTMKWTAEIVKITVTSYTTIETNVKKYSKSNPIRKIGEKMK